MEITSWRYASFLVGIEVLPTLDIVVKKKYSTQGPYSSNNCLLFTLYQELCRVLEIKWNAYLCACGS